MTPLPRPVFHCECGDHAFVSLTRGFVGLVDPDMAPLAAGTAWCAHIDYSTVYAVSSRPHKGRRFKRLLMHRAVTNVEPGFYVDHIDGNGLDNRRRNLRVCTNQENQRNARRIRGASKFKGVAKRPKGWRAYIHIDHKQKHLGNFTTEEDAARSYDAAARKHFGAFAALNFPGGNS